MVALVEHSEAVFCTGDLGFMALEPLQRVMRERFINAGVAEQNMISVAAGIASTGQQCWAYSIAPFIYGRPFEQVRNDVCLHDFDVKLVGNGGGYGYGVMGATHHAIEDYGVLCGLQNMRVYVPAFADDLPFVLTDMAGHAHPAYLRLGRDEKPACTLLPTYGPWRHLLAGQTGVLVAVGPGAGGFLSAASALDERSRPDIWVVTELPLLSDRLPDEMLQRIVATRSLFVVEEHVAHGSVGHMLSYLLMQRGIMPHRFHHFHARGYVSGRYGSQSFHRIESGIDPDSVLAQTLQSIPHG